MNSQREVNMRYPAHFKYRAPEINLPIQRRLTRLIFNHFDIEDQDTVHDPRKKANRKTCGKVILIIIGSNPGSSYTRGLKYHLKTHSDIWGEYIKRLTDSMTFDNLTNFEHFQRMNDRYRHTDKQESSRRLEEGQRNRFFSPTNSAGVQLCERLGISSK